ncbi:hypothetical protein ElyMa_001855600 [Elysia marginata]|uniref:Uncharacterized protein n=1 Tax=Elysia marginata TaxID=1093978 RepID=A0AAV4EL27_9GAST|nr:hypothetical protein ElyMa_001855600 [Elysia marginata]
MCVNSLSQGLNVDLPKAGLEPRTSRSESRASTTRPRRHTSMEPSGKDTRSEIGRYGFDPRPSQTKDFRIGILLVADPSSVWHYGFGAKSGRPGVRIM